MGILTQMRSDTDYFLTQWGEPLLRKRASVTLDNKGAATETWSSSLSFSGDFQPNSGGEAENEAGLEHRSECMVIADYDVDVLQHDRVYRYDENGTLLGVYRVNYSNVDEDHQTIFVYREVQQP